jgi:NADPH:quinone reductase-like Zn-dependent oxidoreductase
MMRAIVQRAYGAADVLRLQDIAAPDPGPHDVLVGVHAASVNHGDWFATCGRPYVMRAAFGMRRPRVAVRGPPPSPPRETRRKQRPGSGKNASA